MGERRRSRGRVDRLRPGRWRERLRLGRRGDGWGRRRARLGRPLYRRQLRGGGRGGDFGGAADRGRLLDEGDFDRLLGGRLEAGGGKGEGQRRQQGEMPRGGNAEAGRLRPVHQRGASLCVLTSATFRKPAALISPITAMTRP